MRWLIIVVMLGVMGYLTVSAQSTDMLIIEGNTRNERNISTLNPLFCRDTQCGRVVDLLFPYLLNTSFETDWLVPADEVSGLVKSWEIDGNTVTYTLRDDKFWSDGKPITAYDVLFSYSIARDYPPFQRGLSEHILAIAPLDAYTIRFVFADMDCDALFQSNFQIIPSHVYDPDYHEAVDYAEVDDIVEWYADFPRPDITLLQTSPEYHNPTVSGDVYHLVERRFNESIHLMTEDKRIAFSFVDSASIDQSVDRYLRGELNLLIEPPLARHDDIRADSSSTIYNYGGDISFFIVLNLADPDNPQPAFDDHDDPIEQGIHPILGDIVVRQAMQMALDVPALMDAVLEGDGVQLAASLPPSVNGYNPDLVPIANDTMQARQLLFDAGWRDMDGDGWRECLTCTMAEPEQQLSITLGYVETSSAIPRVDNFGLVSLIQQQLQDVGIEVILSPQSNESMAYNQRFDAFLFDAVLYDQREATLMDFFRQTQDRVSDGYNITSYHNAEVDRLLEEADHVADCDPDRRRELYQEVEAILQEDLVYLWLFSPTRWVVTRQTVDLSPDEWEGFLP